MKPVALFLLAVFWAGMFVDSSFAQQMARQEFPANHAPIELIRPALEKALSPAGRFVILPGNGNVLVIDYPENVAAAGEVMRNLKVPAPQVAMNFGFKTNVAPGAVGTGPVRSIGGFPYPTRYDPPKIIPNGSGGFIVIPAHPTGFRKRDVGIRMDTTPTVNPDGSINVDINVENTEFEGFINYGSPIFTSGVPRVVPVLGNVGNPAFFAPFANTGNIKMPIFSTTRISTQILVRPTVHSDRVRVDMIPQLRITNEKEPGAEDATVTLQQFRTGLELLNGRIGKLPGFSGASVEFNRNFLGAKEGEKGGTAIVMKAQIQSGQAPETGAEAGTETAAKGEAATTEPETATTPE